MANLRDEIEWLSASRKQLGWSAAEAAKRAVEEAARTGEELSLTQQAVSNFEKGNTKAVPRWLQFVRTAVDRANGIIAVEATSAPSLQFVTMRVALPSEAALTRMFEGLLLPLDRDLSRGELARTLAQRLPIGLAQVQDLLPQSGQAEAPEVDAAPPARATDDRASPRPPRT